MIKCRCRQSKSIKVCRLIITRHSSQNSKPTMTPSIRDRINKTDRQVGRIHWPRQWTRTTSSMARTWAASWLQHLTHLTTSSQFTSEHCLPWTPWIWAHLTPTTSIFINKLSKMGAAKWLRQHKRIIWWMGPLMSTRLQCRTLPRRPTLPPTAST